jgi:hypothetical protein
VVSPRAVSDSTISSTPVRRRCGLRTMAGSKTALPVAGYLDVHWPDLGHRLGTSAVAGVAPIAAHRVVLVISQGAGSSRFQRGSSTDLVSRVSRPPEATSSIPAGTGLLHQFLGELQLIILSRHRLVTVTTGPPVKHSSACRPVTPTCSIAGHEIKVCRLLSKKSIRLGVVDCPE